MPKRSVEFIPPQRSQELTGLAERAKVSLARYAGTDVDYNAVGLQTLDEWIERHLRQFASPSPRLRLVWGAFLGETFRRRHEGQWGVSNGAERPRLGIVCPRGEQSPVFVDVMDQITRRVRDGMDESLAFYYTIKGVEINTR